MKKTILFALALTIIAQGAAYAESDMLVGAMAVVMPSDQPVYLLAEPTDTAETLCEIPAKAKVTVLAEVDQTYTRIHFDGRRGYVPSAALDMVVSLGGLSVWKMTTAAQRENLNGFLTAFTAVDFAALSGAAFYLTDTSAPALAAFAARRISLDAPDKIERSACPGDMNASLPISELDPVVLRYFGVRIENLGSDTYSWSEADTVLSGNTAALTNIIDMGGGQYALYFNVLDWDGSAQMTGYATVQAESLDDPDGFTLSAIVVSQ